jgi:hypothetical protein
MSTDAPVSKDDKPGHASHDHDHGPQGGVSIHVDHASDAAALHDPDLHVTGSYGHTDPASLAALSSSALQSPQLERVNQAALKTADLTPVTVTTTPEAWPPTTLENSQAPDAQPPLNVLNQHLAQVGLVDADLWEEQMKPRIEQLYEEIKDVHVQLDELEAAGRKTKKS